MLCPTRGRPAKAVELLETFTKTRDLSSTSLIFVVDEDDPDLDRYLAGLPPENVEINEDVGWMGRALNSAATMHAEIGLFDFLGFLGDDHRFRTPGWDSVFISVLEGAGGGFAYGNDLLQGQNLPTMIVMNASIVRALGWMSPPELRHLYFDNTWKTLGEATGRLFYLPQVVVEHMHYMAGKSVEDEGYQRVNSAEMYDHDRQVYERWLNAQAARDIATVEQALS